MSSKYQDPSNKDVIIEAIKNSPILGKLEKIIDKYFPDWIKTSTPVFSSDYLFMEKNWKNFCAEHKTTPKRIVIVEFLSLDSDHEVIQILWDILTKMGFCVRSEDELTLCKNCRCALPTERYYRALGLSAPEKYMNVCTDCSSPNHSK